MLIRRLRYWLRAGQRYTDLQAEMEQHLQEKVAELRDLGRNDADAKAEAGRLFGNAGLQQEASRQIWIARYWSELWQDLRYGIRLLTRSPGSTLVTVFALALGIGVNTAVFTSYKAMIARPLDARAPEEMVNVALISASGVMDERFSYQDYEAYRDSLRSFRGFIAFKNSQITFSEAGRGQGPANSRAELVSVAVVSENYFDVLGMTLLQGRTFGSMTSAGLRATPAVLISENYWESRFSRTPSILGRTIFLNGAPVVVAGITTRDSVGTSQQAPTFWVPATLKLGLYTSPSPSPIQRDKQYRLFGRLAPGVSMAQAQAEMTSVSAQLRILNSTPAEPVEPATAVVWPGSPFPRPLASYRGLQLAILLIMVAAGSVLAVACANVGGLRLARARARENELHTRLALGASRLRVVRQLVTESALTGLISGASALFLSWLILRLSLVVIADFTPVDQGALVFDVVPDLRVFAYAFAISLIAGVLSGLGPALEGSRAAISSSARSTTLTAGGRRFQNMMIIVQVALSMVLLIAGAVAIRSSFQSLVADTGYETRQVFYMSFRFPEAAEYNDTRKAVLVAQLRTQTAAQTGVTRVTSAPIPGTSSFQTAAAALTETTSAGASRILYYSHVQANYFETLGIPITRGRGFAPEARQAEHSVVLSEAASRQFWPGENPVGRRLRLGALDERTRSRSELFADLSAGQVYEVAGVAGNTRGRELDGSDSAEIYVLLPEERVHDYPLLVRTSSNPIQVIRGIDSLVSAIDPNIVVGMRTLEELRRGSPAFLIPSIAAAVASTVGLFALLLAVMGIYGTVSYICVLRTREVGIRLALGAQKRDVVRLILGESAQPVLIGLLVGILLAGATSYLAQGLLFGLHGVDIFAFIGVSALFLAIALLASYLPTLRVIRIDPAVALRHE